jgi:hypothetical protein
VGGYLEHEAGDEEEADMPVPEEVEQRRGRVGTLVGGLGATAGRQEVVHLKEGEGGGMVGEGMYRVDTVSGCLLAR